MSFHPKSSKDLRSDVEKQHSGGEVQRSTFARFSGSLDFRLLQQYRRKAAVNGFVPDQRYRRIGDLLFRLDAKFLNDLAGGRKLGFEKPLCTCGRHRVAD